MIDADNPYSKMQKNTYEQEAPNMNKGNHQEHNSNPDYWNILVSDVVTGKFKDGYGLDFGCGCGRNVMNLHKHFQRMDGADISKNNLVFAKKNLYNIDNNNKSNFIETNGVDMEKVPSNTYDFVMSTIVLQHIPVYTIRFGLLKEMYRVLKPGGSLSIQMGFGKADTKNALGLATYYEDKIDAGGTNSAFDVTITDPKDPTSDLEQIGFKNVTHVIRPSWSDRHTNWIFLKATK